MTGELRRTALSNFEIIPEVGDTGKRSTVRVAVEHLELWTLAGNQLIVSRTLQALDLDKAFPVPTALGVVGEVALQQRLREADRTLLYSRHIRADNYCGRPQSFQIRYLGDLRLSTIH